MVLVMVMEGDDNSDSSGDDISSTDTPQSRSEIRVI